MSWLPPLGFWKRRGLPEPTCEYRFSKDRLWRFDFAWPDRMIAIEVEGGLFIRGGHNRGWRISQEMEKYNEAARLGWKLFRFSPEMMNTDVMVRRWPKNHKGKRESTSEFLRSLFG